MFNLSLYYNIILFIDKIIISKGENSKGETSVYLTSITHHLYKKCTFDYLQFSVNISVEGSPNSIALRQSIQAPSSSFNRCFTCPR